MVRRAFTWPEGIDLDALSDGIAVTANSLARRYSRYGVDFHDISQELWLWSLKNKDWVADWLTRELEDEKRQGYAAFTKSLQRAGDRYCRKEKAASLGYETRDEAFYDEGQLKDWLAVRQNGIGVLTNSEPTGGRRTKAPNEGWNVEAGLADLERALDVLTTEQRWLVIELYGEGTKAEVIAREEGVTRQAIENRAHRALRKMSQALGGPSPW